jgi:hypothetical protein
MLNVMELVGWTVELPSRDSDHSHQQWLYVQPPATHKHSTPIPVIAHNFNDAFNYFLNNRSRYEEARMVSLIPQRF